MSLDYFSPDFDKKRSKKKQTKKQKYETLEFTENKYVYTRQ